MRPESSKKSSYNPLLIVGVLRGTIYLILGFFILLSQQLLSYLSPLLKTFFGVAVIAYGMFRIYRFFKSLKSAKSEDDETEE